MSAASRPSARRFTAFAEPAIRAVGETSSTSPTVTILSGIVTNAPMMLRAENKGRSSVG